MVGLAPRNPGTLKDHTVGRSTRESRNTGQKVTQERVYGRPERRSADDAFDQYPLEAPHLQHFWLTTLGFSGEALLKIDTMRIAEPRKSNMFRIEGRGFRPLQARVYRHFNVMGCEERTVLTQRAGRRHPKPRSASFAQTTANKKARQVSSGRSRIRSTSKVLPFGSGAPATSHRSLCDFPNRARLSRWLTGSGLRADIVGKHWEGEMDMKLAGRRRRPRLAWNRIAYAAAVVAGSLGGVACVPGGPDGSGEAVPARAEEVKKHAAFRSSPYLGVYFYRFNTKKAPFDAEVRSCS